MLARIQNTVATAAKNINLQHASQICKQISDDIQSAMMQITYSDSLNVSVEFRTQYKLNKLKISAYYYFCCQLNYLNSITLFLFSLQTSSAFYKRLISLLYSTCNLNESFKNLMLRKKKS